MPAILVGADDQQRLTMLALDALQRVPDVATELLAEMERAEVVNAVPASVVQMGSRVTFVADDGRERSVVLVYPGQADIGVGRISILTPIGTALIGLIGGPVHHLDDARWPSAPPHRAARGSRYADLRRLACLQGIRSPAMPAKRYCSRSS